MLSGLFSSDTTLALSDRSSQTAMTNSTPTSRSQTPTSLEQLCLCLQEEPFVSLKRKEEHSPLTRSVGALLAGQTADRLGRKRTIQLGALIAIIGKRICLTPLIPRMCDPNRRSTHRYANCRSVHCWSVYWGPIDDCACISSRDLSSCECGCHTSIPLTYEQHARGLLSGWTQLMIVWG